jgi:chlorosome envelope protein B
MANETSNDLSKSVNELMGAFGRIGQMQVDIVSSAFKSVASAAEPLAKTASELAGDVANVVTQALQNITSSLNPQK